MLGGRAEVVAVVPDVCLSWAVTFIPISMPKRLCKTFRETKCSRISLLNLFHGWVCRLKRGWEWVAIIFEIPVSVNNYSLCESLCLAILWQKLLSSPRLGVYEAKCPVCLLLWRSVFFTDTGNTFWQLV